jgi:hypothetical protein
MLICEVPGVSVDPVSLKLPETMCVALARVIVPEIVKLRSVTVPVVKVPLPFISSVFPAAVLYWPLVKFTPPETVQVPVPAVIISVPPPAPVKSRRPPTVTSTSGVGPVTSRVAFPELEAIMSNWPPMASVPAPLKVTDRDTEVPLKISRSPPKLLGGMTMAALLRLSRTTQEIVPVEGKVADEL